MRSPFYCEDFNSIVELALENREMKGIYHLGSHRHLSLYQIGQIVNKVGGYAPHLLKGCMRKEAGPMPPRAGNVTMTNRKLIQDLGVDPSETGHTWNTTSPTEMTGTTTAPTTWFSTPKRYTNVFTGYRWLAEGEAGKNGGVSLQLTKRRSKRFNPTKTSHHSHRSAGSFPIPVDRVD